VSIPCAEKVLDERSGSSLIRNEFGGNLIESEHFLQSIIKVKIKKEL